MHASSQMTNQAFYQLPAKRNAVPGFNFFRRKDASSTFLPPYLRSNVFPAPQFCNLEPPKVTRVRVQLPFIMSNDALHRLAESRGTRHFNSDTHLNDFDVHEFRETNIPPDQTQFSGGVLYPNPKDVEMAKKFIKFKTKMLSSKDMAKQVSPYKLNLRDLTRSNESSMKPESINELQHTVTILTERVRSLEQELTNLAGTLRRNSLETSSQPYAPRLKTQTVNHHAYKKQTNTNNQGSQRMIFEQSASRDTNKSVRATSSTVKNEGKRFGNVNEELRNIWAKRFGGEREQNVFV